MNPTYSPGHRADRWIRDPELDAKLAALEVGKRYMIIWTNDSRRTDRMSVLKFLGQDDEPRDGTVWDARPDAGTQTIPRSWILRVEPAAQDAKIRIDEKAPMPPQPEPEPASDSIIEDGWRMIPSACARRDPHEPHVQRQSNEKHWKMVCPGKADLTQSADVGVRWQAQMEELIGSARGAGNEAMRMMNQPQAMRDPIVEKQVRFRVGVAQAHATAALALAISNGVSDLEPVLALLATPMRYTTTDNDPDDLLNPPVPFSPQWHAMRKREEVR